MGTWGKGVRGQDKEMMFPKLTTRYEERGHLRVMTSENSPALVLATFENSKEDPHLPTYPVVN